VRTKAFESNLFSEYYDHTIIPCFRDVNTLANVSCMLLKSGRYWGVGDMWILHLPLLTTFQMSVPSIWSLWVAS